MNGYEELGFMMGGALVNVRVLPEFDITDAEGDEIERATGFKLASLTLRVEYVVQRDGDSIEVPNVVTDDGRGEDAIWHARLDERTAPLLVKRLWDLEDAREVDLDDVLDAVDDDGMDCFVLTARDAEAAYG